MGEKHELKLLKAIEDYRRIAGRFLLDAAEQLAEKLVEHLLSIPGIEKVTPAGSLRRGRETVGDLDILVTGKGCIEAESRQTLIEHLLRFPGLMDVIAQGENKVSFRHRNGMQVDVRLLAARNRSGRPCNTSPAPRRTTWPCASARSRWASRSTNTAWPISKTISRSRAKLKKKSTPSSSSTSFLPELRENLGEIEAAATHTLPALIELSDIRGDVHMHTVETDGRNTIEEMAEAARERGYEYMAITDHSKNLAFANGLTDERALAHIERIRAVRKAMKGIRIFAGIEVDILGDGSLDLSDSVLEQMDIVIASVHSQFNQDRAAMTDRLLKAIANPNTSLIGHPTGRLLLRRDAYQFDLDAVLKAAAKHKVAMELNSYPDRLDLSDVHLRMAKQHGVKIVINTDSHHTSHLAKLGYGVTQARRAWLTKDDVLNTLPAQRFAAAMKHDW